LYTKILTAFGDGLVELPHEKPGFI
jgi:hypothetical protein